MPLGTLERSAPSLFRQGPSALSQLVLYSALALFLMVADTRLRITDPLRKTVAAILYPAQWLMLQPVEWASHGTGYVQSLQDAKAQAEAARAQMARQALQAHQSDTLAQENEALRKLLGLRERLAVPSLAAQILYETADPYTRRVMLDRGQDAGVQPGSPGTRRFPCSMRARVRGGWRMATRWPATAVAWSCALSRPMPMYKTGMCWPPMASMVSILQACPWPVWCVWNAGRTRRLRASTVSRLPPPKGRAMCWCCNRKLCGCPSAQSPRSRKPLFARRGVNDVQALAVDVRRHSLC